MEQRMGDRQRWLWLLSGISAAAAAAACGLGWLWVLAGSIPAALYYLYMDRKADSGGAAALLMEAFGKGGKVLIGAALLWTVIAMAWTAQLADAAFPMVDGFPALGWILLALAAWGSRKGAAACARCAGVLCLFLLVLYGVVIAFSVPDMQVKNLPPRGLWLDGAEVLGLCLLPACLWYLPCRKRSKRPAWGLGVLLILGTTALAAVTAGVLSPELAATLPAPLYTVAQSVSLFGVLERIEPLLSAAMTMGVFCLLSAMACSCHVLADQLRKSPWNGVGSCIAAGVLMGVARGLPVLVLTAGTLIFWVSVPLLAQWGLRSPRNGG